MSLRIDIRRRPPIGRLEDRDKLERKLAAASKSLAGRRLLDYGRWPQGVKA